MSFEFEKNLRILTELLSYACQIGGTEYYIHLDTKNGCTFCRIEAKVSKMSEGNCEQLRQALSLPRQREIEQSYWPLCGNMSGGQLELAGMMLDQAEVISDENCLCVTTKRINFTT